MSPQHLTVIDATLSMPGATLEAEYQHQINVVNVILHSALWKRGGPRLGPANLAASLYLTMMNPVLLPNGNSISWRMRPRLPCAKQWNPCISSLQKSDLSSAFFVWGMLISR